LVVAGNRDELHARPAAPLARWEEPDHLIAGRDLKSGGTWLGVSERGRFAVVTNLRGFGPPDPDRPSRGALVTGLLVGEGALGDISSIDPAEFNPFNLISADPDEAWFLSNRPRAVRGRLAAGIYGLSNGALDEPWPKTLRLKSRLLEWIVPGGGPPDALLDALADETLPDVGIGPALPSDATLEPALSPIFIRNPVYGTRCSTVVAVDDTGKGIIVERRYDAGGTVEGETEVAFSWAG
jgi:uncharacterized protein with NRDE domain